jgi:transcriptional regulator of heat shock response
MNSFTETKEQREQRELREYWDTLNRLGKDLDCHSFDHCSAVSSMWTGNIAGVGALSVIGSIK